MKEAGDRKVKADRSNPESPEESRDRKKATPSSTSGILEDFDKDLVEPPPKLDPSLLEYLTEMRPGMEEASNRAFGGSWIDACETHGFIVRHFCYESAS